MADFDILYKKGEAYCKKHPAWEMICNIEDSDSLYYTWDDLTKREKNLWIRDFGKYSAKDAWEEFGIAKCKVPTGFVADDGKFYKSIMDLKNKNFMMVFKIGVKNK